MRRFVVWGVVWVSAAVVGIRPSEAQYMGSFNVTSLPVACPSANGADGLNDAPAIQCAIDTQMPNGGELYFPAGRYDFDAPITVTNKSISFRGAGQRTSTLLWRVANTHGINFVSNALGGSINHTLNVQSLSLLRRAAGGGNGINAVWEPPSSYSSRGGNSATIFDVHISYDMGVSPSPYWTHGIHLTNALNARISSFNMQQDFGPDQDYQTEAAIKIAGSSKGVVINDGHMGRTRYGVHVVDQSERVRIENVETSENNISYYIYSSGGSNTIANCHAGVTINGIWVLASPDPVIIDNLLYPSNTGIAVTGTPRAQIRGNQISAPAHGILLDGAISNAVIVGNQVNLSGGSNAIVLGTNVSDSLVVANDPYSFMGYVIVDNGTNNVKGINKP